jgi:hypothetical protein
LLPRRLPWFVNVRRWQHHRPERTRERLRSGRESGPYRAAWYRRRGRASRQA